MSSTTETLQCKFKKYLVNVEEELVSFPTSHNGQRNYPAMKINTSQHQAPFEA